MAIGHDNFCWGSLNEHPRLKGVWHCVHLCTVAVSCLHEVGSMGISGS